MGMAPSDRVGHRANDHSRHCDRSEPGSCAPHRGCQRLAGLVQSDWRRDGTGDRGQRVSSIFENQLPNSLAAQGIPPNLIPALDKLSGVLQGVGNGQALLHSVLPTSAWPLIPQITSAANDAFSKALARSFFVTLIAGSVAFLLSLALRDSQLEARPRAMSETARAA